MPQGVSPKSLSIYRNFFRDFPRYGIRLTRHADSRRNERGFGFTLPDLRGVLRRGRILRVELDSGTGAERFLVAGRDVDGRPMELVVALDRTMDGCVHVITVIDPDGSGGRVPTGAGSRR